MVGMSAESPPERHRHDVYDSELLWRARLVPYLRRPRHVRSAFMYESQDGRRNQRGRRQGR